MTPLQLSVFDHVRDTLTVGGFAPSYSELQDRFALASKAQVARIIDALVADGRLVRTAARQRNLALAAPATPPADLTAVATESLQAELRRRGAPLRRSRRLDPFAPSRPCAVPFCQDRVGRGQIYCRTHWFTLPKGLRGEVLEGHRLHDQALYADAFRRAQDFLEARA